MYPNGLNAYKNNSVNYASREQLLLMLVDGAVRFSKQARQAMVDKDISKTHECIVRVQDIFIELMSSLDRSAGDWAEQIFQVYSFINSELVKINIKKNIEEFDKLIPLVEDVRNLWYEVEERNKAMK